MEGERGFTDGEGAKSPCETKENHDCKQASGQADVSPEVGLVVGRLVELVSSVLHDNSYRYYKDDHVHQENRKNRAEECPKENSDITDETAGRVINNYR